MLIDYGKLTKQLLQENDLLSDVNKLREDDQEDVYFISRHAMEWVDHKYDAAAPDSISIELGVRLGLELLRYWAQETKKITSIYMSDPFLAVDEDWLAGVSYAAPPYVYICLAKTRDAFQPAKCEGAVQRKWEFGGDTDLTGVTVMYRKDEVGEGVWLLKMS